MIGAAKQSHGATRRVPRSIQALSKNSRFRRRVLVSILFDELIRCA